VRVYVGGLVAGRSKGTRCDAAQEESDSGHAGADDAYVDFEDGHIADSDVVPCVIYQYDVADRDVRLTYS